MDRKIITISLAVLTCAGLVGGALLWKKTTEEKTIVAQASSTPSPTPKSTPTPTPIPTPDMTADVSSVEPLPTQIEPTPEPEPTPPPLDESDDYIKTHLGDIKHGSELLSLLTKDEIVRKVVRAVYGLSEGRVVREYRPVVSPSGQFKVNKIGQQTEETQQELYRINRENYARYTSYISLFSAMNNDALPLLYKFYLPTFENAYNELGIGKGDFHSTLIRAIDIILQTPTTNDAMLLIQPSVMFKFSNPELEKLPSAHKLMLRMGPENSEVLKLELQDFKKRLLSLSL